MASIITVKPTIDFNGYIDAETGEILNHVEGNEMQLGMEEDDEEITLDVSRFAQVQYNLEGVKTEVEEPPAVELTQNKENYCHLCQHTFTNK